MKQATLVRSLLILAFGSLLTLSTAAQSLGDAARQARKNKPAEPTTKVITNDDIATSSSRTTDTVYNTPDSSSSATTKPPEEDKKKSEPSAEDRAKQDQERREKIAAQQEQISKLEKELDQLQHDVKQRASNYYGDAGTRLRDPKKYADDEQKSRDQIAAKQKELADAKTKLEQLQDEDRKANAP